MIRQQAGLSAQRFCAVAGIPRPTWYRQRERALGGRPAKGPWPQPARRRVEAVVHAYALRYPAWGHRKIWALTVADGHQVSVSTVHRIMLERGLLHPRRYQAERRELAKARKQTFHDPPTRRDRVWQTDFSELETRAGGTWQMGGVVDYVEVLSYLSSHRDEDLAGGGRLSGGRPGARRRDPRPGADRGSRRPRHRRALAGRRGDRQRPCYKAGGFARYIRSRAEFEHVRTRHRSPENGVIERWYRSLKYEHLYLQEIDDGPALAEHVLDYARIYNDQRPHEAIGWQLPRDRYTAAPGWRWRGAVIATTDTTTIVRGGPAPDDRCHPAAGGAARRPQGGPAGRARRCAGHGR